MIMLAAVGSAQARGDTVVVLGEVQELGLPLDVDAQRFEPFDQELLVLVLREISA